MIEAMRASRTTHPGSWFALVDRDSSAATQPVRAERRVAREAGRLNVADPDRQPLAGAAISHPRGPRLLASAALHAALLAALLLTARAVLPPEPDEAAVPLVFEPAPDAAPPTPLADTPRAPPQRALEPAETPEAPILHPSPADTAPLLPLAEPPVPPPSAATTPLPDSPAQAEQPAPSPETLAAAPTGALPPAMAPLPAPPRPRTMPAPPPVRPVAHLPPQRPAPPSPAPSPATRPDAPAREAPPPRAVASEPPAGAQAPPRAARTEASSVAPRPLAGSPGNVQPAYPEQARRRGIEGRVVVRATVSPAGRVLGVAVAQGSGSDALDRAALEAVRGYSFTPATRGGAAVEGVAELPFTFRLAE